jgi:hypothetical protein
VARWLSIWQIFADFEQFWRYELPLACVTLMPSLPRTLGAALPEAIFMTALKPLYLPSAQVHTDFLSATDATRAWWRASAWSGACAASQALEADFGRWHDDKTARTAAHSAQV